MPFVDKIRALFTSKSRFMRDVLTLMTGTGISRLFMFAAIPVLTRIYTPAEFGLLALFALVNAMFITLACGGYESSIVIQKDDRNALHMVIGCMLMVTTIAVCEYAFMLFWAPEIATFLNADELSPWLLYSPVVVWTYGMSIPCLFWLTRRKRFKDISTSEVITAGTTASSQILLGTVFKTDSPGLIIGNMLGRLAYFGTMTFASFRQYRAVRPLDFSFRELGGLLARYKNFPIYNLSANFLNAGARELPVLILGAFFAPSVVGLYSLANRLVTVPLTLIVTSTQRVFLPKAKEALGRNRLDQVSIALLKRLALLGIAPALMLIVAAPELITVVLGDKWADAGSYVQFAAIWGVLAFLSNPYTEFFYVLERLRHRLTYFAALALVRFIGLAIGGYQDDPLLAVALASIGGGLVAFLNASWLLKIIGVPLKTTFGIVLLATVKALPYAAIVLAAKLYGGSTTILLATLVITACVFLALNGKELLKAKN